MLAVLHLLAGQNPAIPTDKKGNVKCDNPWNVGLQLMGNPNGFMDELLNYKAKIDDDKINPLNFKACKPILADETFTVEKLTNISSVAAGLCSWVVNINVYYDVYVDVEPKRL
jgi:dynein heavy chain